MVVKRSCSFCSGEIEPGTGMMYVKKDGTVFYFCSAVCRRDQLELGRVGHRFKWTRAYQAKKALEHSQASSTASAKAPVVTPKKAPGPKPSGEGAAKKPAKSKAAAPKKPTA